MVKKFKPDSEYIASGEWKCGKSPSGAHHWIRHDSVWICKYCLDMRVFPNTWFEILQMGGTTNIQLGPPADILEYREDSRRRKW